MNNFTAAKLVKQVLSINIQGQTSLFHGEGIPELRIKILQETKVAVCLTLLKSFKWCYTELNWKLAGQRYSEKILHYCINANNQSTFKSSFFFNVMFFQDISNCSSPWILFFFFFNCELPSFLWKYNWFFHCLLHGFEFRFLFLTQAAS